MRDKYQLMAERAGPGGGAGGRGRGGVAGGVAGGGGRDVARAYEA